MKAEFQKLIKLYEELQEAGETATLTLSTRGGKSTIKLQLESSPSLPATSTTSTHTLPPASGRRRRHRGARARARRNQRAAAHQTSLALFIHASVSSTYSFHLSVRWLVRW